MELEPQQLAGKLVVLLMLSLGLQKSDLLKLNTRPQHMLHTDEAYYFALNVPSKGYKSESHAFMQYMEFKKYLDEPKICPYLTLNDYLQYLCG